MAGADMAFLDSYVAVGCLIIDEAKSGLPHALWWLPDMKRWRWLTLSDNKNDDSTEEDNRNYVPQHIARTLLWADPFIPCRPWVQNDCLRISFSTSLDSPTKGIARIYTIADDMDNIRVPRQVRELQKFRAKLFDRLDRSRSTWCGETESQTSTPTPSEKPGSATENEKGNSQSLLQMFNTIPSPHPDPSTIIDLEARAAAKKLLDSDVPGLQSTLYDYQRLSAALMLQREVQPEQALDPRLSQVVDQEGRTWYHDPVSGASLRKPRYYDMPSGGILAEEMGSGKTVICLALILATKHLTTETPDLYRSSEPVRRQQVASLADMAAACITKNSVPWKSIFLNEEGELEWGKNCVAAIRRHPGSYLVPRPPSLNTRSRYVFNAAIAARKVYNSHASLVIVPPNLSRQWQSEIQKHAPHLKVLVLEGTEQVPPVEELLEYELILFTSTRFERLLQNIAKDFDYNDTLYSPLTQIQFKRCIVDEGHKLGNCTFGKKSNLLIAIDHLQVASRWIVTGTPSKGLYGIETTGEQATDGTSKRVATASKRDLDNEDAKRIGNIAGLYLKMRPWANKHQETGDTPASWADYVLTSKKTDVSRVAAQRACLKSTLDSVMIRHPLTRVSQYLPKVEENYVYLDPSYQDLLAQNLFSMMIIYNSVQSQRTDQDFFFHPQQRKALMELTTNLQQASFFGGSFFSPAEIVKATKTAEKFLADGKVKITKEDEELLRQAISFGRIAETNSIKRCAYVAREVPVYLDKFPWGAGKEWSIDDKDGDPVCTDPSLVLALQRFLHPLIDAPASLGLSFSSGRFAERGKEEKAKRLEDKAKVIPGVKKPRRLAGHTKLGEDNSGRSKRLQSGFVTAIPEVTDEVSGDVPPTVAAALAATQLISTASAKLSYLIDQITKYQADEQIIVFYENENVAYYLAGTLEILGVHHLIYARGITPARRSLYVETFNTNPKFRVLLMDIRQAAFGLDMKSASRIYFINPVLNPQVEAQAVGRVKRISQQKPVTVQTLVLRNTLEEMIVQRRREMSQAEQRKIHTILDDRPIYNWILNAKILPMPDEPSSLDQMARLEVPQHIFGRGFGREIHPDEDLVDNKQTGTVLSISRKRDSSLPMDSPSPQKKPRVRFVD